MNDTKADKPIADDGDVVCCRPLAGVDTERIAADVQLLSAMGNDTRYELLRLIDGSDSEVCVCDLEGAVGVTQGAVSQALSRLHSAGLVTRRKEENWRYYGLTEDATALLDALDRVSTDED
jgi:ArsR family transcriptional regulator